MDYKNDAQKLVDGCLNTLSIQYDSDGKVMKRHECLPKARMFARNHINFALNCGGIPPHMIEYWVKVKEEVDNTF